MKKFLFFALLTLLISVSCSSESKKMNLVGKWKVVEQKNSVSGKKSMPKDQEIQYIFNSNGYFQIIETKTFKNQSSPMTIVLSKGQFTTKDDSLVVMIFGENDDKVERQYSFNDENGKIVLKRTSKNRTETILLEKI